MRRPCQKDQIAAVSLSILVSCFLVDRYHTQLRGVAVAPGVGEPCLAGVGSISLRAEIEDLLDRARLSAEASPEPDPSGALDYLYSGGLRGRAGTA